MRSISLTFKNAAKLILFISILSWGPSALAQSASDGAAIFKQKCTACHAMDRTVVGPALKGMTETREEEWLIKWIKNSQAMVASGDPLAVEVYEQYNKIAMPSFPELSDDDVRSILAYIEEESNKAAAPAGGAAGTEAGTGGTAQNDEVSNFMLGGLIVVVIAALLIILVLNRVIKTLERLLLQKQGLLIEEEEEEGKPKADRFQKYKALAKNKKFMFFVVLLLVIFLGSWGWNIMWNTGVHTGYQPVQPIKFPHDVHAGVNKIDCQYCHSGAAKSKNASIPSANVCMNCHNYVTASEKYNGETSPEIMKIYKALDYDPETKKYGPNKRPIEWIRIHNLPDLAYFNHSQHVTVAGIECQKCHGPVETMPEVYQYSPLTMKWCINCHRETEVNFKGNAYYDQIIAAHDQVKKGEKITAAVLGGTECVKCHY